MTVERLVRPSQVLELWAFFEAGLSYLQNAAREQFDPHQMQKMLCAFAADDKGAWLGVVFSDEGDPICFGVAHESTLPFSQTRTFEVRAVYHRPDFHEATLVLAGAFESWCRDRGVAKYHLTTKRNTGAVIRCFRHEKFGFDKPFLVFEKAIR